MQSACARYSLYQKYFNKCLREWYHQKSNGSGFYYANPPGILFTPLRSVRSSKRQEGTFSVPMSHWFFDKRATDQNVSRNVDVFRTPSSADSREAGMNYLHMGYDVSYTLSLGKLVHKHMDITHTAFCNHYDIAFNTLYNVGRSLDLSPEAFTEFPNFRLVTGNIFGIHSILTEPCFRTVIMSVRRKNMKEMLHYRTLTSVANAVTKGGCIILIARDTEGMNGIQKRFDSPQISQLFVQREGLSMPAIIQGDENGPHGFGHESDYPFLDSEVHDHIKTIIACEANSISQPLYVYIYHKYSSKLPNQRLSKPVNTV
ncbi:hypothetical protein, conserved [Babesia bigemina]|uniref:Uncharacterized protein n=1 Tax=Babesia bigemina TaxID=5866 RepID=A0A061D1W0_BABBI|nr:hypothetical protein, conserved [Babesia bigemina]CDR94623.1 hypothetical protein, conserved [Babesia bigemina]|eukprot:XP_012766809.1 hypothetical protein, conserved [Babesia bigemina]